MIRSNDGERNPRSVVYDDDRRAEAIASAAAAVKAKPLRGVVARTSRRQP